jgi:hypothetical protein
MLPAADAIGDLRIPPVRADHPDAAFIASSDTLWGMCRAVTCKKCGRPTWKGCGAHVEQVLGDVPRDERCQCRTTEASATKRKSWFSR